MMPSQLTTIIVLLICVSAPQARGQFFETGDIVLGKTIPEWAEININWDYYVLSQNPPLDTHTVHPDNLNTIMNDGPVFFIASLGTNFNATLLVPPGRPILQRLFQSTWERFPQEVDSNGVPIALSGNPVDGVRLPDPDALLNALGTAVNSISPFFWEYDGVAFSQDGINAHRVEQFYTAKVPNGVQGVPAGEYPQSASVGYWFMHEPFEPGEQHTIALGAITPEGERFPELTIRLLAVPEPSSTCLLVFGVASAFFATRRSTLSGSP
jgi:hypothetical protein